MGLASSLALHCRACKAKSREGTEGRYGGQGLLIYYLRSFARSNRNSAASVALFVLESFEMGIYSNKGAVDFITLTKSATLKSFECLLP